MPVFVLGFDITKPIVMQVFDLTHACRQVANVTSGVVFVGVFEHILFGFGGKQFSVGDAVGTSTGRVVGTSTGRDAGTSTGTVVGTGTGTLIGATIELGAAVGVADGAQVYLNSAEAASILGVHETYMEQVSDFGDREVVYTIAVHWLLC